MCCGDVIRGVWGYSAQWLMALKQKAKTIGRKNQKQKPHLKKKIVFPFGWRGAIWYITQILYTSDINLYLCFVIESYQIEIVNRLFIGPVVGLSIYLRDDKEDMGEVILYLGLISIHLKYW